MHTKATTELEVFIRQKNLISEGYVSFSAPTLWRRVKDGSFPAPVKLSPGVTAWRRSDVVRWQQGSGVKA